MLIRARDIPLIFVALTLSLLIFAFAWTAPWPQLCPEQNQQAASANKPEPDDATRPAVTSQPATDGSDGKCDEHAKSDWWAIRIGLLTLAVLAGQLIMFWRQLGAMQVGVKDAATAAHAALANAKAALSSAETMRHAERAYLKMSHVSERRPGLHWLQGGSGEFEVLIEIRNYGRTPARVTAAWLTWEVIHDLVVPPNSLDYNDGELAHAAVNQAFLVPGDPIFRTWELEIRPQQYADVLAGDAILIVYGYVDYIDQFGTRHRGGYGRRYIREVTPNNLVFPDIPARLNYDEPRAAGVGWDWNDA